MAAQLMCLTASGGVPLFSRTKGNVKQLPFPLVASLNGVHMFCKNHDVKLQSCLTQDTKVVWKDFKDSISLVLVVRDDRASDVFLSHFLHLVTQSLVLLYGHDDLANIKNVERFKRDIKVCYSVLDHLLDLLLSSSHLSLITGCVDVILTSDSQILQTYLDAFVSAASSPYGFLVAGGRVVVATSQWWAMDVTEQVLLVALVSSMSGHCSRDVPVFLPVQHPNLPHRLLTFELVGGVEVCLICGSTPTLAQLQPEVERFWRSSVDSLRSLVKLSPRNLHFGLNLHPQLIGLVFENTVTRRCVSTVHINDTPDTELTVKQRRDILSSYYKHVESTVWGASSLDNGEETSHHSCDGDRLCHEATDTYICTDTHKCYALQSPSHRLLCLYTTHIPTYAMRSITNKTLQMLLKDKHSIL